MPLPNMPHPDMKSGSKPPVFNLPSLLVAMLALLIGLYLVETYLLSDQARSRLLFELAFTPLRYVIPLSAQGLEWLWTPVTYSLLHGSAEHLIFNCLWLAAFGAPVFRRLGPVRFFLFWILSAAASAFFHAFLNWGQETVLIGASGVISAMMAAACRFAFPAQGAMQRLQAHTLPRQGIVEALRNRTVLVFTLIWFIGNGLIAVGIPLIGDGSQAIAWDAHIGGFLFGYLLFALFDPVSAAKGRGR
ncbi:rhomboid family intramembrane serine protease [Rhizobium sp. SSA_523]|uniref:rhomboid family intramembrane serine protease n=1 Tax=Rhizobium sp. SSA_523 TaxID=2952477 RepID=UPI0020915FCB|nr:rhomboid family intramembrane serine protease [Rhizobium sp. SSA_523]MCO5733834.1 rhomboid family intramembrane serine protease [Rhizobium sp. SSA_523]WKC25898.1 rhomboid family intramembrane serine protease [Rhizobium sp. SSA_523]